MFAMRYEKPLRGPLRFASVKAISKRRDGRVVEGTPLLRVQGRNLLESSNLSLSAIFLTPRQFYINFIDNILIDRLIESLRF